ncbi:metalloregulator ArsR/SmtB family transcription factor [Maribrevibacterium harenarium]|uniref:Metalloregulator ArsR/SmtB family transcription factor n=1 Tax=Maribrevibacterium harenarium TaxID=2589817 RepID=A0A501WNK6_9GAMM|nr:metalloregulator ArsR/SmtB family transcription factor [Maribrevibacterium harenarium]TPE48581.1 metalloregulator ArsR/SmtB family transcription factor [Maribrevibacterium harenarium]
MNPIQFYKCLADDTRLRCLLLIQAEGELCVCELMAALKESQPKISRHLAQLRQCGILSDRRQGQWVFYRLAPTLPTWALEVLQTTLAGESTFIAKNQCQLTQMGEDRPKRTQSCCS